MDAAEKRIFMGLGAIAQLVERLFCTQEARSSTLLGSTKKPSVP